MKRFLLPALFLCATALGQVQTKSLESVLTWTPPKLNEDGTPLTDLAGYLFSVAPAGIDLNTPNTPPLQTFKLEGPQLPQCPGDVCEFPSRDLLDGLPAGNYRVWGQAYDLAGNLSKYSIPSDEFNLDVSVPTAPTGLKVEVRVIVEVRVNQ